MDKKYLNYLKINSKDYQKKYSHLIVKYKKMKYIIIVKFKLYKFN